MNTDTETVRPEDARPMGKPGECFYCQRPVGEKHKPDCVIVSRTVVVRYTIDVIKVEPRDRDRGSIEFGLNDSSWCAGSIVGELSDWYERQEKAGLSTCLCPVFRGEYLREATEEDHETLPYLGTAPLAKG